MLIKNGKEYYPLDCGLLKKDNKVYYNRENRKKSYFYIDFRAENEANSASQPPLPFTKNNI